MVTVQATQMEHNVVRINNVSNNFARLGIGLLVGLFFWMLLHYQVQVAHLPTYSIPILKVGKTQSSTYSSILKSTKQRIVILAGPHKTGSSSIQSSLYSWSKSGSLGHDWTWVTPNMTCVHEHSAACQSPPWLSLETQIHKVWNCAGMCIHEEAMKKISNLCSSLMTCYSGSLGKAVFAKKNIVFGYESFAFDVVHLKETGEDPDPMQYIQKILNILPSTVVTKDDITVVITYRVPRIDQVTSNWKHQRDVKKAYYGTALTFRSFLSSRFFSTYYLDSLRAAKVIAEDFGLNVVILDTSGIQSMGYDISNVVACDILGSPCNRNNMSLDLFGNTSMPTKTNVRKDDKSLNDLTFEENLNIESILHKLDCNSAHFIFQHPKIQVIYPYLLNQTRASCSMNHTYYTHEKALQDIRSAVTPKHTLK